MSRSEILYQLQQFDSELDKSSKRIHEIEEILGDREQLKKAITTREEISDILADKNLVLKQAENNVEDQSFKIAQNQKKLYSGVVTNPKDLEDLQLEAETLQRYLGVLEERQLEAMLDAESCQKEYDQAAANVEEISDSLSARDNELNAEKSNLITTIEKNEQAKKVFLAGDDIPDLQTYQSLRKSLNGIAVALMISDSCRSCGSNIPSAIAQEVRSPGKMTSCPTCRRILHPG